MKYWIVLSAMGTLASFVWYQFLLAEKKVKKMQYNEKNTKKSSKQS